jgi:two-component system, sensor histidine kinase
MSLREVALESEEAVLATRPRARSTRLKRVLIVDDVAENCLLLGLCCDQFGFVHEAVTDGHQAVERARSCRFDVILMDIFMPRMDGLAATHAIRALPRPMCLTPIIAVTTAAAPGEVLRYLCSGMTDVVAKPVNPARLAEAISLALGRGKKRGAAHTKKALRYGRPNPHVVIPYAAETASFTRMAHARRGEGRA